MKLACTKCGTELLATGLCPACSARVALIPDDALADDGRAMGNYELFEEIGRGGMGIIYRARQRRLGRIVAVKVLRGGEFADSEARERFRFLHVSTDEVYGSLGAGGLFSETTAYDPRSPYAASKAASDFMVSAWGHTYGLPVLISNCSNNYGPFQFPEKLIPTVILNAIAGRPIPVYGDGGNVRDWLFVDDHVEALLLIAAEGRVGETYNVGGRNERTNIEVVRAICGLLDEMKPRGTAHADLVTFVTDRPGHDRRYAIDATKLETELGWRAGHAFDVGLRETVRWYLDRADWWMPIREGGFSGERLGLRGER